MKKSNVLMALVASLLFAICAVTTAVAETATSTVGVQTTTQVYDGPVSLVNNASDGKRGLPISGNVQMPGLISDITGPVDAGPNYSDVRWLLYAKGQSTDGSVVFTRGEIEEAYNKISSSSSKPMVKEVFFSGKSIPSDTIRLYFQQLSVSDGRVIMPSRPSGFQFMAQTHTWATKSDQVTAENLVIAMMNAMNAGANCIISTGQGAKKHINSNSWGIGFTSTAITLSEGGQSATAATGVFGAGYAHGESHCDMFPWNMFIVGRI